MLQQILDALDGQHGPMSMQELSLKLGVEPSALQGMITFWARKGRLIESAGPAAGEQQVCSSDAGACGPGGCPGPESCPFVTPAPRKFTLP